MTDLDITQMRLLALYPKFSVVAKRDSLLMKFINVFLIVVSFGTARKFMTDFITTIGFTVYVPDDWELYSEKERNVILRHESVHMAQRVKYGMFLFSLLYLLCPLPIGLAYFRAKFEKEAYEETILAMCQLYVAGVGVVQEPGFKSSIMSNFTGPSYLWMWPFKKNISNWYDAAVKKAIAKCGCVR